MIIFLIGLAFLLYFSYMDISFKEVENKPILAMFLIGVVITIFNKNWLAYTFAMAFMAVLGIVLWKRKVWGGADAKILPCIVPYLGLFGIPQILAGIWLFLIIFLITGTLYGLASKFLIKEKEVPFVPVLILTYLVFYFTI